DALRLQIRRDPAPWRSPWAYAAYILIIAALVAYRMKSQREKFQRVVREQKRLEASAKALTERIVQVRTLVEALPDRLWVVDSAGRRQWSPKAGGTAPEENGQVPEVAPSDKLPEALAAIGLTAADGKQRKVEFRLVDISGSKHSYELRFTRRE